MDDEAILAGLDREPDAFAVFFRRHFAALLEHFASRTRDRRLAADLCAETFATALADADRFDPARGLAVDWLHGIGQRLLDEAGRRGAVRGRARRPRTLTGPPRRRTGDSAGRARDSGAPARVGSQPATSARNAGSSRIGSKSESSWANARERSEMSIERSRCSIASAERPARLSQQARL